jgi:hypothetical protein
MTGETPDRPAIPETSFDAVRVDRGVRLLLDDAGTVTHVEIDLNRAHAYDGNGYRLVPGVVRGIPGVDMVANPPRLLIEAEAFRRLVGYFR